MTIITVKPQNKNKILSGRFNKNASREQMYKSIIKIGNSLMLANYLNQLP